VAAGACCFLTVLTRFLPLTAATSVETFSSSTSTTLTSVSLGENGSSLIICVDALVDAADVVDVTSVLSKNVELRLF
jgi:hypothetical protein